MVELEPYREDMPEERSDEVLPLICPREWNEAMLLRAKGFQAASDASIPCNSLPEYNTLPVSQSGRDRIR